MLHRKYLEVNKMYFWQLPISHGCRLRLPSCSSGFESEAYHLRFLITIPKGLGRWEVAMAQFAERSLLAPEDPGSKPVLLYILWSILKKLRVHASFNAKYV